MDDLIVMNSESTFSFLTSSSMHVNVHEGSNTDHISNNGVILPDEIITTDDYSNTTLLFHSNYSHDGNYTDLDDQIINLLTVQVMFSIIYSTIFILGIIGNVLVCFVVMRNKAMQTATNFFITNLALADILLCALAVPFTPMYTFLGRWVFGQVLCHLVPYAQGTSVYISTLTLTSIAIDRYCVIIYPFRPRMKLTTCFIIIVFIWTFALLVTMPYGFAMKHTHDYRQYICIENWSSTTFKQYFSGITAILQFVLPFIVMAFCYIKVSLKLSDRAKAKPGSKNSRREAVERERKRRTNRMLIAMVTIFGFSWLPLNFVNFFSDLFFEVANILFFLAHAIAMSSTCYNPFLYAWLNENFRKEFKQVLPCFYSSQPNTASTRRVLSERTCNGNETVQETFLATNSQMIISGGALVGVINTGPKPLVGTLETIEEQTSNSQTVVAVNYDQVTAKFSSETNQLQAHIPVETVPDTPTTDSGNFANNTASFSGTTTENTNKKQKIPLTQLV